MATSRLTVRYNKDSNDYTYFYDGKELGTTKDANAIVHDDDDNIIEKASDPTIFQKLVDLEVCDESGDTSQSGFSPAKEGESAQGKAASAAGDYKKIQDEKAKEIDNAGFVSVENGYGDVPSRSTIKTLVRNTSGYGSGLSSLMYPADLLDDENTGKHNYNGSYTVMFISEHKDSTISHVRNFTTSTKYINNQGSSFATLTPDAQNSAVTVAGGTAAALLASKGISNNSNAVKSLLSSTLGKGIAAGLTAQIVGTAAAASLGAYVTSKTIESRTEYTQLKTAIALPTPTMVDQHNLEWDQKDTMLGAGLVQLASDGQADGYINTMINGSKDIATAAALTTLNTAGAADTLATMIRKAPNTRREQIFQNVGFRTFTLEYSLAARDRDEVSMIESIIRVLKYHAYPELSPSTFLYIYPAHFDIVHYFGNTVNSHMPRHATSVLKSIQIDYSGGNSFMSFHHDGSPVYITMRLEFVELAILSKDSIKKGY